MKFRMMGRLTMALVLSLAIGLGLTACSRDYTVAWVYVTTTKATPGLVYAYGVDFQSGVLTQLADSPVPATGNNPVAIVVSPDAKNLYVALRDANAVEWFQIGTDGKIYGQKTYNVTGSFPTAMAIDSAGKFLYVTFTYQPGFTPVLPGPGGITVFPINKDASLGTPLANGALSYFPVGNNPVGIAAAGPTTLVPAGSTPNFVYVIDQEPAPGKAALLTFGENGSTGVLTPAPGTSITTSPTTGKTVATGYGAGTQPSAIVVAPTGSFLYVTDQASNVVLGYSVQSNMQGQLLSLSQGPFPTGLLPVGMTIDPRGSFLYVVNYNSNTVNAYVINKTSGALTGSVGGSGTAVGAGPVCVTVEPALGIYLYTANNLSGDVSGEQLDPHNGGLVAVQNSPYPAGGLPSCAVAVANGSHATQVVLPAGP